MKTNMKKIFAAALLCLLGSGAYAQTSTGSVELSGSIGFSTSTIDLSSSSSDQKFTNFRVEPSVGYFVADNLAVGVSLSYTSSKRQHENYYGNDFEVKAEERVNTYFVAPYIRKYFPLGEKVALHTTGSLGLGKSYSKTEYDHQMYTDFESETRVLKAAINPGITFFPTQNIGVSANFGSLYYLTSKNEQPGNETKIKNSEFNFDLSSGTFGLGFSYFINR